MWERACSRIGPQDHRRSPPSFTSIFTIATNAFRKKTVRCRINLIPIFNPAPEGQTMLIHLLTCLALTAVTLTLFSRLVLDIGQTEEPKS